MLKAYYIRHGDGDDDFRESILVYHENEDAARRLGRGMLSSGPDLDEVTAERAPEHDERCAPKRKAHVEEDVEYLRNSGWRYEGENTCCSCGLAAFGMEKYGVCRVSHQCKECGCEEYENTPCSHDEGFSCE
jgi:hypothetical protein